MGPTGTRRGDQPHFLPAAVWSHGGNGSKGWTQPRPFGFATRWRVTTRTMRSWRRPCCRGSKPLRQANGWLRLSTSKGCLWFRLTATPACAPPRPRLLRTGTGISCTWSTQIKGQVTSSKGDRLSRGSPPRGNLKGGSHLRGNPPVKGVLYPPWGIGQPGGAAPGVSQFTSVNLTGKGREAGVLGLGTNGGAVAFCCHCTAQTKTCRFGGRDSERLRNDFQSFSCPRVSPRSGTLLCFLPCTF